MLRGVAAVVVLVLATGCVVGARDVAEPDGTHPVVIVGSAALPAPLGGIARHPWVAMRPAGSTSWERWEVMCCPDGSEFSTVKRTSIGPTSDHGGTGGDVRFHAVHTGGRATEIIECVRDQAPRYPYRDDYQGWPGPNSNTFVDWLVRACNINAELPSPSIGRDYRGIIGASWTAGGTGFQIDTYIAGFKLGLTEGVEIHILGMAFGIDLWPPAIIVPIGPGRIGFADR
jgi:hypothetical protein